ncbi:hypothetical protein HYW87_02360 [Candidatus Roizmanbacteria bacterium]|nr:hypothetical protein [Candidatus Roizmanbacteria bacterium]
MLEASVLTPEVRNAIELAMAVIPVISSVYKVLLSEPIQVDMNNSAQLDQAFAAVESAPVEELPLGNHTITATGLQARYEVEVKPLGKDDTQGETRLVLGGQRVGPPIKLSDVRGGKKVMPIMERPDLTKPQSPLMNIFGALVFASKGASSIWPRP